MPLDSLPDAVLDGIIHHAVSSSLTSLYTLLTTSARVRRATLRILFHDLCIPDDSRHLLKPGDEAYIPLRRGPATAFIAEPDVYGDFVKTLTIIDPIILEKHETRSSTLFHLDLGPVKTAEPHKQCTPTSLPAGILKQWLEAVPRLEGFVWKSAGLPPDGICETLASVNKDLLNFAYIPHAPLLTSTPEKSVSASIRSSPTKWDAPSLPHLSQLMNLKTLSLSRLSQNGSRSLSHLLRLCALGHSTGVVARHEDAGIEDVAVDVLWFDEELCDAIAGLCRRTKKLKALMIGTAGTTLRDKGLQKILKGCDCLEALSMSDVEGRISRTFWASAIIPRNLRSFSLSMSEAGPHHSWAADHLSSLASLSLGDFESIHITRTRNMLPELGFEGTVDDIGRWPGSVIPREVVDAMKGPKLRTLECDWWLWRIEDVKSVLDGSSHLESVKLALDAPFSKIFSLIPSLAGLRTLRVLSLSIPVRHAPVPGAPRDISVYCPPSPVTPIIPYPLLTPASSPVKRGAYGPRVPEPATPPMECTTIALTPMNDPAMPTLRDIKKLAKRCEKLELLEWYGHNARGSWLIEHEATIKVTFHDPPPPSEAIIERIRWEQAVSSGTWTPDTREGQAWIESVWLKREIDKEKQRALEKERERERERMREQEKQEKKAQLEKQKTMSTLAASASPNMPASPAEEQPQSQFPPPSASRLNSQKKTTARHTDLPSAPSATTTSGTTKSRGVGSPGTGRRTGGRGRGNARPGATGSDTAGTRIGRGTAERGTGDDRRASTTSGRGAGRGRGRGSQRGSGSHA